MKDCLFVCFFNYSTNYSIIRKNKDSPFFLNSCNRASTIQIFIYEHMFICNQSESDASDHNNCYIFCLCYFRFWFVLCACFLFLVFVCFCFWFLWVICFCFCFLKIVCSCFVFVKILFYFFAFLVCFCFYFLFLACFLSPFFLF